MPRPPKPDALGLRNVRASDGDWHNLPHNKRPAKGPSIRDLSRRRARRRQAEFDRRMTRDYAYDGRPIESRP